MEHEEKLCDLVPAIAKCKTSHRHGHTGIARTVADGCGRLRTVADGCERLRTVATVNATSSEHTLNPQTPRVKREPLLRIREKQKTVGHPTQGLKQSSAFRTRSATLWPCSLTTKSDFMAGLPQIIRFRKGINYNQQNYKN